MRSEPTDKHTPTMERHSKRYLFRKQYRNDPVMEVIVQVVKVGKAMSGTTDERATLGGKGKVSKSEA